MRKQQKTKGAALTTNKIAVLAAVLTALALLAGCTFADDTVGDDGASAYELAVAAGFDGSDAEWLASLVGQRGPEGPEGPQGPAGPEGPVGPPGADGKTGSTGPAGRDGRDGHNGAAGRAGVDGANGASAYELAVAAGYEGTMSEWLASLKGADGEDGADGASAYELAVAGGYEGTVSEWLASLAGGGGVFITADQHDSHFATVGPTVGAGASVEVASVTLDPDKGPAAVLTATSMLFPLQSNLTDPNTGMALMMGMGWLQKGSGCPTISYDGDGRPIAPASMVAGSEFPLLAGSVIPVMSGATTVAVNLTTPATYTLCVTIQPLVGGEMAAVATTNLTAVQGEAGSS